MANDFAIDLVATGARIKAIRKALGLRVTDISDYMGFTEPQAVYKWQRGESLPTLDNMIALAKLFNTRVEDIVVLRGEERDSSPSVFYKLLITTY